MNRRNNIYNMTYIIYKEYFLILEGKNMTVTKTNGKAAIETRIFNEDEKEVRNNTALLPMDGKEREEDEDEITLEDLAPDGGWGWMVAIAMILIFVSISFFIKIARFYFTYNERKVRCKKKLYSIV